MAKAKRLIDGPDRAITVNHQKATERWPKYVPRLPQQHEALVRVERPFPRTGPVVYQVGDYFSVTVTVAVPEGLDKNTPAGIIADWYEEHDKPMTAALARGANVVVVVAGKAFLVGTEISDQRLQYLVVRLADARDEEAVAAQKEAERAETARIMDRMMNS